MLVIAMVVGVEMFLSLQVDIRLIRPDSLVP